MFPEKRYSLTKGYHWKRQLCHVCWSPNSLYTKIILSSTRPHHDIQPLEHKLRHSILYELSYAYISSDRRTVLTALKSYEIWSLLLTFLLQKGMKLNYWDELMSALWNSLQAKLSNFLWNSGQQFADVNVIRATVLFASGTWWAEI